MNWHADAELLDHYAAGTIDPARAFSLEAHLLSCAACRAAAAAAVPGERVAATWSGIEDRLDALRPGLAEQLLVRVGVRQHLARLLAATPALRLSWLAAVALVLAFAVAAAYGGRGERGLLPFLVLAPLVPLAGVAAAFAPGVDPTYELALAAPLPAFKLLLVRCVAVLGMSLAVAAAAALALPDVGLLAVAWLLPALGLSLVTLAAGTFVPLLPAAGLVAGLWVAGVVGSEAGAAGGLSALRAPGPVESLLFHGPGQAVFLMVGMVAAAVLAWRRDELEMGRNP
jgi:hypothetical protein